jgi:hypothetical protein
VSAADGDDDDDSDRRAGACTRSAKQVETSCSYGLNDDYWASVASCNQIADRREASECLEAAKASRKEAEKLCEAQLRERLELCENLGEAPYDPVIDPALFVDPSEIGRSVRPNRYFPLLSGRTLVYRKGNEVISDTVTGETRTILGVPTAVVHNVVRVDGEVIEDTKDWYAQDIFGNVWYFGEISFTVEDGEVVSIEGSWTAGRDHAKPGTIMAASPKEGDTYRQEFLLGEVEDVARVLSVTGTAAAPVASCNGDCLVTDEFSPIEPGLSEHKYYAPGIGKILEVDPLTGERLELVDMRRITSESIEDFGGSSGEARAGIEAASSELPRALRLSASEPNPLRSGGAQLTTIRFELPRSSHARVAVHDVSGRVVRVLQDGKESAGRYVVAWDGKDTAGNAVASGVYFVALEAAGERATQKISVVR